MINSSLLEITGSIHKYYKGGNDSDFTFVELQNAISKLCNEFKLMSINAKVVNVEIGVNIQPEMPVPKILEQMLCFKNKEANYPYRKDYEKFIYTEFPAQNYFFKVYDKGKQYNNGNTLRLETKFMRSKEFNPLGLTTLADLTDIEVYKNLAAKFLQHQSFLKFTDNEIDPNSLSEREKQIYFTYNNPKYWSIKKANKRQQLRNKDKFIRLINNKGNNLNKEIAALCKEKVHLLSTH